MAKKIHTPLGMAKFVHDVIFILKYLMGVQNIVHYSPAFLSLKDLADTKEMSRNKARNTAVLILLMRTQPERT